MLHNAPASERPHIKARAEAMLKGVSGHHPPEHSALNQCEGGKCSYKDEGTMHHAPKDAHPGEGGWHDKHEATRHSRKSMKSNRFM